MRFSIPPFLAIKVITAIIFIALSFNLFVMTPVQNFPDTGSYIRTAQLHLLSLDFWTAERPPIIPLLFKVAGNDFNRIAQFQQIFSLIAWLVLAASVISVVKLRWLRVIAFAVVLGFSLADDLHFWNSMILSESFSISLFVITIAVWLQVINRLPQIMRLTVIKQLAVAGLVLGITGFWAITRDTNMYFMLGVAGFLLIGVLLNWKTLKLFLITLMAGCLLLFGLQNFSADEGQRWILPFYNVLGQRILKQEAATSYFIAQGMPDHNQIRAGAGQFGDYFLYQQGRGLRALREWTPTKGKSTYMRYLLAHPIESLRAPLEQIHAIYQIDRNLRHYSPLSEIPAWQSFISDVFYPRRLWFEIFCLLGGVIVLAALVTKKLKRTHLVPIVLLLLAYPVSFLVWHGDAMELERHSLNIALQWRLAIWLFVIFTVDSLPSRQSRMI